MGVQLKIMQTYEKISKYGNDKIERSRKRKKEKREKGREDPSQETQFQCMEDGVGPTPPSPIPLPVRPTEVGKGQERSLPRVVTHGKQQSCRPFPY